ncbi:MAG: DUF2061 domain-containing protein [Bacteroidota bacterium]
MEENKRSFAKAISWRITGTICTVIVALAVTGDIMPAIKIGSVELVTKMLLYYLHERAWMQTRWGIDRITLEEENKRSAAKSLTWRITGTIDTVIIALIVTGNITSAINIGIWEWVSKLIVYYFHERAWNMVSWGKVKIRV